MASPDCADDTGEQAAETSVVPEKSKESPKIKGSTEKSKKFGGATEGSGRKLGAEEAKQAILTKVATDHWPPGLSEGQRCYYKKHYIKEDGKKHGLLLEWLEEARKAEEQL